MQKKGGAMKTLVVEDDYTSRVLLKEIMKSFGPVDTAVNGREAVDAVCALLKSDENYDVILLDIMMPEMNGQEALINIREAEKSRGIEIGQGAKVIMTTALADKSNVMNAFRSEADAYIIKPVERKKLLDKLTELELISPVS
jgi:two-component system chemotaxis response regulator CheY